MPRRLACALMVDGFERTKDGVLCFRAGFLPCALPHNLAH